VALGGHVCMILRPRLRPPISLESDMSRCRWIGPGCRVRRAHRLRAVRGLVAVECDPRAVLRRRSSAGRGTRSCGCRRLVSCSLTQRPVRVAAPDGWDRPARPGPLSRRCASLGARSAMLGRRGLPSLSPAGLHRLTPAGQRPVQRPAQTAPHHLRRVILSGGALQCWRCTLMTYIMDAGGARCPSRRSIWMMRRLPRPCG
jgi:hypothetical protein